MILAFESSCDESAIALFDEKGSLISEWIQSQISRHAEYGGVVPDLAVGEHLLNFFPLLELADEKYDLQNRVSSIAVTCGPGLIGCLGMGLSISKTLGLLWDIPVWGVNHLRGHAFSPFMALDFESYSDWQRFLPHLGLLASGGNTILFKLTEERYLEILAQTVDDAAGEAFDKGAKLMGIPYPGGAELEKHAKNGNPNAFAFPRAFSNRSDMKFSFSGLKTSLLYALKNMNEKQISDSFDDLCASYQAAAVDQLSVKTSQALEHAQYKSIGLSGGVANNERLRESLREIAKKNKIFFLPAPKAHCGDNASMIAHASLVDKQGLWPNHEQNLTFQPTLSLDQLPGTSF